MAGGAGATAGKWELGGCVARIQVFVYCWTAGVGRDMFWKAQDVEQAGGRLGAGMARVAKGAWAEISRAARWMGKEGVEVVEGRAWMAEWVLFLHGRCSAARLTWLAQKNKGAELTAESAWPRLSEAARGCQRLPESWCSTAPASRQVRQARPARRHTRPRREARLRTCSRE